MNRGLIVALIAVISLQVIFGRTLRQTFAINGFNEINIYNNEMYYFCRIYSRYESVWGADRSYNLVGPYLCGARSDRTSPIWNSMMLYRHIYQPRGRIYRYSSPCVCTSSHQLGQPGIYYQLGQPGIIGPNQGLGLALRWFSFVCLMK